MPQAESTCWTVIEAAAAGHAAEREEFARRYGPAVRGYLAARWRSAPCLADLDDAVQEVFVECFKRGGALEKADRAHGGFRPFLYGMVRNVARRFETNRGRQRERQTPGDVNLEQLVGSEETQSRLFDRAWARAILREAARIQEARAGTSGEAAVRRVELLRLRFQESLPIRDIAERWGTDPAVLHHEYAKARQEFKAALLEAVAFHYPGTAEQIERECANLLALLG